MCKYFDKSIGIGWYYNGFWLLIWFYYGNQTVVRETVQHCTWMCCAKDTSICQCIRGYTTTTSVTSDVTLNNFFFFKYKLTSYHYRGVASEHSFANVVREVQRIANVCHPTEQVRQAQQLYWLGHHHNGFQVMGKCRVFLYENGNYVNQSQ